MNRTTWRLDTVTRRTCEHGREVRVGGQVWLGVEGADAGATTNPAARCPEGMEAKPLTSSSDFHYLPPSTSYLNHPVTFKFCLLGCRVDDMDRTSGPNRVSAIVL